MPPLRKSNINRTISRKKRQDLRKGRKGDILAYFMCALCIFTQRKNI